jgi:hypothetical protein
MRTAQVEKHAVLARNRDHSHANHSRALPQFHSIASLRIQFYKKSSKPAQRKSPDGYFGEILAAALFSANKTTPQLIVASKLPAS